MGFHICIHSIVQHSQLQKTYTLDIDFSRIHTFPLLRARHACEILRTTITLYHEKSCDMKCRPICTVPWINSALFVGLGRRDATEIPFQCDSEIKGGIQHSWKTSVMQKQSAIDLRRPVPSPMSFVAFLKFEYFPGCK